MMATVISGMRFVKIGEYKVRASAVIGARVAKRTVFPKLRGRPVDKRLWDVYGVTTGGELYDSRHASKADAVVRSREILEQVA